MPARKNEEEVILNDPLTIVTAEKKASYTGPYVDIFLPALDEPGGGLKVDQYEHVTLANEKEEICYKVIRGERVSVPVPVFIALKERYPKI